MDKDLRQARGHLRTLIRDVRAFLDQLDAEMKRPPSHERGGRIAALANRLDMAQQIAKRFGLPAKKRAPNAKVAA